MQDPEDWPCDLLLREIMPHEGTDASLPHYYSGALLHTPSGPVFVRLMYVDAAYTLTLSANKPLGFTAGSGQSVTFLFEVQLNDNLDPCHHRLSWCSIGSASYPSFTADTLNVLDPRYYPDVLDLRRQLLNITDHVLSSSWWSTLQATTNLWRLAHLLHMSHASSFILQHALADQIRSLPKSAQALLLSHSAKPLREMAVQIIFSSSPQPKF